MKTDSLMLRQECIIKIRNAIFNYSLSHDTFTIPIIASLTGYSTTTISKYVKLMKDRDSLVSLPAAETGRKGRKAKAFAIKFEPSYFLGVDIKYSGITFGLMNMNGAMVRTDDRKDITIRLDGSFTENVSGIITEYINSLSDIRFDNITGISVNIRGSVQGNAAEKLSASLGIPTSIENDTNAMAYCEYQSLNPNESNLLYINFGWGLGLGIIINRKLYHGSHGNAGEIGHMPMYNNNILCHCGKKGCLETEVSISAIIRKIKDKVLGGQTSVLSKAILAGEDIKVSELIDALKQEDPLCLDIVSAAANELGKYLSGVACLFDPDSIILAGPLSGLPEYCFLDHVRLSFQRYIPRFLKKDINFSVSTKGKDSSIIGACLIARDSSSLEDKAMRKTENGKTMKIPFIKYLEYMDEYQLSSALVRNTAGAAIDVVNWPQLYPYAPKCLVRLARSHTHFVISFSVSGMDLRATEMEDNGRSWEDSCCEFFISPDGKTYYNIEITCIGSIRIGKGTGRNDRTLVDKSEVARVKRWSSLEKKRYEEEGGNYHWTVTALIPYSVIGIDADNLPTEFRGNFFKCGDRTAHPHFISWNPIKSDNPDFHKPEFFGKLLLVEE